MENTMIHVVRTHDEGILHQPITSQDLCGNCRFCEVPGVKFAFRPQCGECGSEGVDHVRMESAISSLCVCFSIQRCCSPDEKIACCMWFRATLRTLSWIVNLVQKGFIADRDWLNKVGRSG